jgi:hypothetical protein
VWSLCRDDKAHRSCDRAFTASHIERVLTEPDSTDRPYRDQKPQETPHSLGTGYQTPLK